MRAMGPSQQRCLPVKMSYLWTYIHCFPPSNDTPILSCIISVQKRGKRWDLPKFVDVLFVNPEFPILLMKAYMHIIYIYSIRRDCMCSHWWRDSSCSIKGTNNYIGNWWIVIWVIQTMHLLRFARPSTDGKSQNVLLFPFVGRNCPLVWSCWILAAERPPEYFCLRWFDLRNPQPWSRAITPWYPLMSHESPERYAPKDLSRLRRKLLCSSRA